MITQNEARAIVLLVSSNSSGRGGGEKYLVYLARGLQELKREVHVLLSTLAYMDVWAAELTAVGAVVHRIPLRSLRHRPLRCMTSIIDYRQMRTIAEFVDSLDPDAVLVNQQYDEDGLDYVMGAKMSACKRICGVIHMPMTEGKDRRLFGKVRGTLLKQWYKWNAYPIVFVSRGAQLEFEAYYPKPRPTYVVNNAIEAGSALRDSERLFWGDGIPTLGFIGQFVEQKNLMFIIQGWLKALGNGAKSRILLIGDGPQRGQLENYLWHNAPVGSWYITGWNDDTRKYFPNIDLFLLLSKFEGLSLSLLEVASFGIPSLVGEFNGADDVRRRAHWVKETSNCDLEKYCDDLMAVLNALPALKKPSDLELSEFRQYFSLRRMAKETLDVLEGTAITAVR